MDDIMNMPSPFAPPTGGQAIPEEFEKLRYLEQFSEDMFNRIIAVQEKEHPAWNTALDFAERIKGLPLHALIFSNPDRDPETSGPTIAPFYPLRGEMQQIAHCARQVAEQPVVCEMHASNGFIGSLLGREGVDVIGLRSARTKPNQISEFYDASCYTLREGEIEDIDFSFDVALSAWMPSGCNLTPAIVARRPKLIVFIHTDHVDDSGQVPQTGTRAAYRDLPEHYQCIAEWAITRPKDLLHEIWPDLTPSIEEVRYVRIFADAPYHGIDIGTTLQPGEAYDWEIDLDMALTAYQAKLHLREQGFPV